MRPQRFVLLIFASAVVAHAGCNSSTLGTGGHGGDAPLTGMGGVAGTAVVGSGGAAGADSPGTAGITGGGGVTGAAGVTGTWCPPPLNCGVALCGNGARDTCAVQTLDCHGTMSMTEACDGADLGVETCQSRGYASGDLACSDICTLDAAGCSECVPLGAKVSRCGSAPLPGDEQFALAMAATDSEVALAWEDADRFDTINFTRLSSGLDAIGTTLIDETAPDSLSVAPLPSGWAVAGHNYLEIFTHAVDAAGVDRGRIVVDKLNTTSLADMLLAPPRMASRPNGGPLIVWATVSAVRVSVVSADGRSASTPKSISTVNYPLNVVLMNAAWVGDAFYVAMQIADGPVKLTLLRVEADGTPTTVFDAMPGSEALVPTLVTGADDLRVVYLATMNNQFGAWWRKLGLDGQPLSPPRRSATTRDGFPALRSALTPWWWSGTTRPACFRTRSGWGGWRPTAPRWSRCSTSRNDRATASRGTPRSAVVPTSFSHGRLRPVRSGSRVSRPEGWSPCARREYARSQCWPPSVARRRAGSNRRSSDAWMATTCGASRSSSRSWRRSTATG
jgi:hypothetical protein